MGLGHRLEDCWLFPGHDTIPVESALLFGLGVLQQDGNPLIPFFHS